MQNSEIRDVSRRNTKSHKAIIDATIELLGSEGYLDISMEKIAKRAGVGKQTLYRWWGSKVELVLEVWRDHLLPPVPEYDGKTLYSRHLEKSLVELARHLTVYRQAALYVLADQDTRDSYHQSVYLPRIEAIKSTIRFAVSSGKSPSVTDTDLFIDQTYGAIWYKVLIRSESVDSAYVKRLVSTVLDHHSEKNERRGF